MIVAIGAGLLPDLTLDPRRQTETMTAFIAATGIGDVPTGSIEYKTIFAVGLTLFVITLVAEPVRDPDGAPLPGGLRMTTHAESPAPSTRRYRGR